MSTIKIEIKNARQIKQAFSMYPALMNKNLNIAIKSVIFFIRAKSVENAPAITGYLRSSAYTSFEPLRGEVGFKAKYAPYVHDGTGPYEIRPKNGKALFWKGAEHPVRVVHHPGIKANPFLKNAVEDNDSQIDKFFVKAVKDTMTQVGNKT